MDDLISRQAAIDAIGSYILSFTAIDRNYYEGLSDAKRLLNDIPSAELIRCKDCIYYRQEIDMCDEPYSTAHNVVHEDDYCSRAESGLLEIMGTIVSPNAGDSVEGFLTADDIIERIRS